MPVLVVLCVSLGLDSLRVAATLGLGPALRHRVELALAFGVCDGAASLLGLTLGHAVAAALAPGVRVASAVALGLCAVWLLVHADDAPLASRGLLVLPAALSLDNLAAGVALGTAGVPALSAVVLGVTSAAMAGVGLAVGAGLRKRVHRPTGRLCGFLLLTMAGAHGVGLP